MDFTANIAAIDPEGHEVLVLEVSDPNHVAGAIALCSALERLPEVRDGRWEQVTLMDDASSLDSDDWTPFLRAAEAWWDEQHSRPRPRRMNRTAWSEDESARMRAARVDYIRACVVAVDHPAGLYPYQSPLTAPRATWNV